MQKDSVLNISKTPLMHDENMSMTSPRGKRVQRQPMTNGGINVEIGNPSYNMYEVEHDNHADAGSFLKPNFTLDPHKVCVYDLFTNIDYCVCGRAELSSCRFRPLNFTHMQETHNS